MAVLLLVSSFINKAVILEIVPFLINRSLTGPITPLNKCSSLVPLANRLEVKEVCKLGTFNATTKDDPRSLKLAPSSAKLGAKLRASGEGHWITIWNLPLYTWSWNVIVEVLRAVRELVALSQAPLPHKRFISALVRRRVGVALPLELNLSLGMRKYSVIFTGDRDVFLIFQRDLYRYVLSEKRVDVANVLLTERRSTHEVPSEMMGKQLQVGHSSGKSKGGVVEYCSCPGGKVSRFLRITESSGHGVGVYLLGNTRTDGTVVLLPAVVKLSSHDGDVELVSQPRTSVH